MHILRYRRKVARKLQGNGVYAEKCGKGKNREVPLAIAQAFDPKKVGVAFVPSERVIMIPLRPKNVGPSLRRGHFAATSLVV